MLISVYVSKMARPLSKLAGNHNGRFAANDIIRFRLLESRLHFGSFFLPEFYNTIRDKRVFKYVL